MIQKENIKPMFFLFCKLGCFFMTFFVVLALLTPMFTPKFYYQWASTAVIDGFYELEEDTVDVFFMGSSQVISAISPMQLYEETGVTSYVIGTDEQGLYVTYYLLQEVLRYQQPKVVVLDLMFLYPFDPNSIPLINTSQEFVNKVVDYVEWSPVKWNAIMTLTNLDPAYELKDYLFPLLRYHSRWSELKEEDFAYYTRDNESLMKGFYLSGEIAPSTFAGFTVDESVAPAPPLDLMVEYLNKIAQLCNENNISLVLIKTPRCDSAFTAAQHNTMQQLADSYGVPLIDFNEVGLYEEIGYDPQKDFMDSLHVNYWGAAKITSYLSDYLTSHYDLEDKRDNPAYESWNEDLKEYQEIIRQGTAGN